MRIDGRTNRSHELCRKVSERSNVRKNSIGEPKREKVRSEGGSRYEFSVSFPSPDHPSPAKLVLSPQRVTLRLRCAPGGQLCTPVRAADRCAGRGAVQRRNSAPLAASCATLHSARAGLLYQSVDHSPPSELNTLKKLTSSYFPTKYLCS